MVLGAPATAAFAASGAWTFFTGALAANEINRVFPEKYKENTPPAPQKR